VAVVPQAMEYGDSKAARNMVFLMFNDIEQPNVDVDKPNMIVLMFNDIEQHELKKKKMKL
jgi:hypothetical protein